MSGFIINSGSTKWLILILVIIGLNPSTSSEYSFEDKKQPRQLMVPMTLVPDASALGAVCLDGSPPAYHLHRGSGSGTHNWILQFEGGEWCSDVASCLERSRTKHGSTKFMNRLEVFSGILSDNPSMNPDFYDWNRVKLRYCDGASFGGDSEYINGTTVLFFRGQRIWDAIVVDLFSKGFLLAEKDVLLVVSLHFCIAMISLSLSHRKPLSNA